MGVGAAGAVVAVGVEDVPGAIVGVGAAPVGTAGVGAAGTGATAGADVPPGDEATGPVAIGPAEGTPPTVPVAARGAVAPGG